MEDKDIYLHLFNAQELGYRGGEPKKAGRYLYVSKEFSQFFGILDSQIVNDYVLVNIIGDQHPKNPILAKYVYHNDKYALSKDNGRDEFRLYFNSEYDPTGDYFKPKDILVVRKFQKEIVNENGVIEKENIFRVFRIPPEDPRYRKLSPFINDSKTHALSDSIELANFGFEIPTDIELTRKIVTEDIKEFVLTNQEIVSNQPQIKRVRNVAFRDLVMMFYNYQCCISGGSLLIEYGNISNLEAAHIIPFSQGGMDNPINGIPLNRGLHWAFDNGFFTIESDYTVEVHEEVKKNFYLNQIDGKGISVPEDSRARPNIESLKWHKENIFGKFRKM